MENKKTLCVIVLGAISLLVIAWLGTSAYAAPPGSDSGKQGSDVTTTFDPFSLTRIAVEPAPQRPTNPVVLMGSRGNNGNNGNGNGNGNGKRPPVIPPRPPVRSPCRPSDTR